LIDSGRRWSEIFDFNKEEGARHWSPLPAEEGPALLPPPPADVAASVGFLPPQPAQPSGAGAGAGAGAVPLTAGHVGGVAVEGEQAFVVLMPPLAQAQAQARALLGAVGGGAVLVRAKELSMEPEQAKVRVRRAGRAPECSAFSAPAPFACSLRLHVARAVPQLQRP
jgi:hypothetical protein